jgi:hypothetical protein
MPLDLQPSHGNRIGEGHGQKQIPAVVANVDPPL